MIGAIKGKWQWLVAATIILLTVALNWSYFKPQKFYAVSDSQKLSGVSWEGQRKGALLDYLPKTALEPREAAQEAPLVRSGQAEVSGYVNRSNSWLFLVDVKSDALVEIPVYYFPGWVVKVNGKTYPYTYKNYTGRIAVNLAQGKYTVEGRFMNTPLRTIANSLTVINLLAFIGVILYGKNKKIFK